MHKPNMTLNHMPFLGTFSFNCCLCSKRCYNQMVALRLYLHLYQVRTGVVYNHFLLNFDCDAVKLD